MQIVSQRGFRLIYFQIKNNFPANPDAEKHSVFTNANYKCLKCTDKISFTCPNKTGAIVFFYRYTLSVWNIGSIIIQVYSSAGFAVNFF